MTRPSLAERGRRAGAAAFLVVVSAGVAQTILANPEPAPAAAFGAASTVTATSMAAPPDASSPTTTAAKPNATATAATGKPADPKALAVTWYADRHGLDRSEVKALQADKLTGAAYRVLLMVTKPDGRLDSAVVTVTRSGGAWRVEARRG
jgi:hypothetical protein